MEEEKYATDGEMLWYMGIFGTAIFMILLAIYFVSIKTVADKGIAIDTHRIADAIETIAECRK